MEPDATFYQRDDAARERQRVRGVVARLASVGLTPEDLADIVLAELEARRQRRKTNRPVG